MKKSTTAIAVLFTVFSAFFIGCSKDNMDGEAVTTPKQKIGEGFAAGAAVKVELYVTAALSTGYNQLLIGLSDSATGQRIEGAQITLVPLMDMGMMKHAAPVENPSAASNAEKLFQGAVVFIMPSGSMGTWTLDVNVQVGSKQGKLTVPVTVAEPAISRLKSFVSKADNSKFFVAYINPAAPKVGVNDMEVAIYKTKNLMEYPADSSLSLTLTPEMPTMGHGSPNNVAPAHTAKGHYKGKVNFTMTGLWYLNLDFMQGAAVADTTAYFEVNF